MIVTSLEQAFEQIPAHAGLKKGLEFLLQARGQQLPDGRMEIEGSGLYCLVQSFESLPPSAAKYEAHRRYMDIQYVQEGVEMMGWAPADSLAVTVPYNEEKDIWFGTPPQDAVTFIHLSAGQLAIFFPDDAHAPKLAAGQPAAVKKSVVKVALDALRQPA
jgi:biofilm protein TabA